ncbi:MAG: D-2-hydroxyacid dehydrogenase [Phycisphaerales bacterium]|nr:D-2-hydroxyacid dehydrogenase [Phycisphaerales bacterium]
MRQAILVVAACLALCAPVVAAPPAPESIGSLDGARVAFPIAPGEAPELVYLVGGRVSDEQIAELRAVAPRLEIVHAASAEEAMTHAPRVHGADSRFVSPEFLAAAPNLVWVQSTSAGVEWLLEMPGIAESDGVVVTNMRAVHGPTIADHSFAMLLTLTRGMRLHDANQRAGRWGGAEARAGEALEGRTMFVVGLGGIGTEIARRADGFGMHVIASRRTRGPSPEFVDEVGTPDQLHEMLARADVVAIATPLTPETEGMFDAEAFAAMKPGAYLINIARGSIVNTDAMVGALDSGRLAGVCLDVTDPEPLPEGHTLWGRGNVVITPHVSAFGQLTSERWWAVYRDNVRRFAAGEPLLNTVDKKAGY